MIVSENYNNDEVKVRDLRYVLKNFLKYSCMGFFSSNGINFEDISRIILETFPKII
jgi:hypothetical protein